jgi:hypothetical protein
LLADWIKPDNSLLASPIVGSLKGVAGGTDGGRGSESRVV